MPRTKNKPFKMRAMHYRAIELRYEGKSHPDISEILSKEFSMDIVVERVRRWFMSGGALDNHYLEYAKKENHRRRRLMVQELQKLAPKYVKRFEELLDRRDISGALKLDAVTVNTLRELAKNLHLVETDETDEDPVDSYWARAENELDDQAENNTPVS